jgi:hypothetical protein
LLITVFGLKKRFCEFPNIPEKSTQVYPNLESRALINRFLISKATVNFDIISIYGKTNCYATIALNPSGDKIKTNLETTL